MDELITWLRAQLDEDEANLRAGLAEYAETNREAEFRFRLAEVDAKRRILDEHAERGGTCTACSWQGAPCHTVRLLALPYADRPGYQEGWRP
jgi:hypothetical protein